MKRLYIALIAVMAAQPALALSCIEPSVEAAFTEARDARELYVPAIGRFTGFVQRPNGDGTNGQDRHYTARFTGHAMTADGPGARLVADVRVTERCLGPWCPVFPANVDVLTFIEQRGNGFALEVNACHGNYFAQPTPGQRETMRRCLEFMDCAPPQ